MRVLRQKPNNNFVAKILMAALILSLIFGMTAAQTTVEDLKNTISSKQQTLDQLTSQIQDLQSQINAKQKQAASLKNEVALYDLQIRQTQAQITAVQTHIDQLTAQIAQTEIDIQTKQKELDAQKQVLAETLRLINEYDQVSPIEMTLANHTFSQFLDQVQYTQNLQEKTETLVAAIKQLKTELENKKADLQKQLAQQQQLQQQLNQTQVSLQQQRDGKQYLLAAARGQERIYQSLLADAAKKQEQIEREIYETEIAIRQRLGIKNLPPISGVLRWPMSGILTQGYGNTGFTALGYNFHNGIDIAAPPGTNVYAAGDGLVYATGTGQTAYGNWVVIKHTISKDGKVFNIYTLYGHLQRFVVSPNQAVRGGDLIGYEGNTGNTTRLLYGPERGYHLHFTVFDEEGFSINQGAYQNLYGPYQLPTGYTYDPMLFLQF